MSEMTHVQISHGGGGQEMGQFIRQLFFSRFGNEILKRDEDAASLSISGPIAMTTDSFTVSPLFFPGGNIGSLAIAGTCNDLAMAAAKPTYLSCGFMIEEGLALSELTDIVDTMARELSRIGAQIVCGDTKVVPKGSVDKVFINTTGIGSILRDGVSAHNLQPGDCILVSRDIGCHGACVLAQRESMALETQIESDCDLLWPAVNALLHADIEIHAMRDATRGGLSAVLNEWCQTSQVQLVIDEQSVPVTDAVRGLCELFGFEPYDLANEGTFVLAVPAKDCDTALAALRQHHTNAACIGTVQAGTPARPILCNPWGSRRYLDFPAGELLPRIC